MNSRKRFQSLRHNDKRLRLAGATEAEIPRDDAYALCSLAADLHVTQAVDQTKGVHATIAKSLFK